MLAWLCESCAAVPPHLTLSRIMNTDTLQLIFEKIFPFAWNYLDVRHMTSGHKQLKVFLKDLENRDACEETLATYRDQFARIDIVCNNEAVTWNYLNRIDFVAFRISLSRYIQAVIDKLQSWDPSDPIYAFVIAVFPSEGQISYAINTESAWLSKLERRLNTTDGEESDNTNSSKYCCAEFTTTGPEPATDALEDLWGCCGAMREICDEYYHKSGNDHAGITFYQNYLRRFMQMAVHALRENIPALERLPVTDDFVAYVEDYTGSGDPIFTMMETIPLPILEAKWPQFYRSNG